MKNRDLSRVEPKGDCPFCDAPPKATLPLPAGAVCVDTGVSVRAYRK